MQVEKFHGELSHDFGFSDIMYTSLAVSELSLYGMAFLGTD